MAQYKLRVLRSNLRTFYGLHLHLTERCCKNFQSATGPAWCKIGPAITWLVGVNIYIVLFFNNNSLIHLHLASFYAQNTSKKKKKLAMENADWTNRWTSIEGAWAPWPNTHFYNWLFSLKTKISKENLRVGFHLLLKCCTRQCTLLPPTWTKSRTIKL